MGDDEEDQETPFPDAQTRADSRTALVSQFSDNS